MMPIKNPFDYFKVCPKCKESKHFSDFPNPKSSPKCKLCVKESSKSFKNQCKNVYPSAMRWGNYG